MYLVGDDFLIEMVILLTRGFLIKSCMYCTVSFSLIKTTNVSYDSERGRWLKRALLQGFNATPVPSYRISSENSLE